MAPTIYDPILSPPLTPHRPALPGIARPPLHAPMRPIRLLKIDLNKIPASAEYQGKNGARYVTLVMMENRDGEDQYGNLGFAALEVTREEREAGERGAIVGNWKDRGQTAPPARQDPRGAASAQRGEYPRAPRPSQRPAQPADDTTEESDIPF